MVRAGIFDDFKGATTLLVWGDKSDMEALLAGLSALRRGERSALLLGEGNKSVSVTSVAAPATEWSHLRLEGNSLRWDCSTDILELAEDLVRPLLDGAGHQFLGINGCAEQAIIAR